MKSALVMFSGGMDSATALYLTAQKFKVTAIFFDFGQRCADLELTAARYLCRAIDVPLEVVDVSGLKRLFLGLMREPDVALGFAGGPGEARGNCPHGLFGVAATYCMTAGFDILVTGMHSEDAPGADRAGTYLNAWGAAIRDLQGGEFRFDFPLLSMTKVEIVALANELGVPLEVTRSCSEPTRDPCGRCQPCMERDRAFEATQSLAK